MTADYRKQIEAVKVGLDNHLSKVVRLTALAVMRQVVLATPVDTGRAKANWWLGVGEIPRDTREPNSGNETAAAQTLAGYKVDKIVYISNNLPYIRRLNDGYSKQAPASFVESASQVGAQKAKEIAKSRFEV